MTTLVRACLLAVTLGGILTAATPVGQDKASPVRFPAVGAPAPGDAPAVLTAERLYVIDSDVDAVVLASPQGLVKVIKEPGPLRVRGRFVDGAGIETRPLASIRLVKLPRKSSRSATRILTRTRRRLRPARKGPVRIRRLADGVGTVLH